MSEKSLSTIDQQNRRDGDEDESNAITMLDVLKEESELEEDANAVLGASDPQNCTYPQGYVKRQAIYACATCIPPGPDQRPAGICLACSYSCHEGHDLVELYTKRNFRCDCGNPLFEGKVCSLEPAKEINEKNKYNQNFHGVYCTCKRPYPDPEDTSDDEMIQCIVCEDWYHGRHLGLESKLSIPADYGEMICEHCMEQHEFLWNYAGLCLTKTITSDGELTVDCTPAKQTGSVSSGGSSTPVTPITPIVSPTYDALDTPSSSSPKKVCAETHSISTKNDTECSLLTFNPVAKQKGATFWPENWRKHLCVCPSCQEKYEAEGISYLTDPQDTVQFYEEQGKAKRANGQSGSQYDHAMEALSQLDRTAQIEAIHGYNEMKEQLKEYLQKFAENRKVVREEDIREFFSQMSRKRPRVEIPSVCR